MARDTNEGCFWPGSGHPCAGPSRARLWVHGLMENGRRIMALTQKTNSIDQIAAWAGALEAGQVPPAACALAKKAFLDTLAVSLSGSQLDSARIVSGLARELGQSGGPCSVIGHGSKADVLAAALANGT